MSHTPGPWKSVQVGNTKVSQAIIAESETSFTLVATARPQPSERLGKQEDNARLIAAAPDLLGAGERLSRASSTLFAWDLYSRDEFYEMYPDMVDLAHGDMTEEYHQAQKQWETAIAKARGEP
jgi:hypothetical protein